MLYLFCSFLFVAAPEGRAEEGLQLSDKTDWITLHPVRVQVWVSSYRQVSAELWSSWREEGMYCLFLCTALIGLNVTAVRHNTQNYHSKPKKEKWANLPNTISVLVYSLVVLGWGAHIVSSDWQLNQLWNYDAIAPFVHVALHKLCPYWITN